uniref:Uncharacterized protein n=1 Tax=Ailuropoda melanoleuca TaxID=9646 RepID=A0A7N5K0P5_AILME
PLPQTPQNRSRSGLPAPRRWLPAGAPLPGSGPREPASKQGPGVGPVPGCMREAVYRFPGQVWHLELSALRRLLYVLCAQKGIYSLPLDQASR